MKKLFKTSDFTKNKNISNLKIREKDGRTAYKLTYYEEDTGDYLQKICIRDMESGNIEYLDTDECVTDFFWNLEGLVCCLSGDDSTRIMRYDIHDGSFTEMGRIDLDVRNLVLAGEHVFFTASCKGNDSNESVESSTILPFYSEMYGLFSKNLQVLYSYSLTRGELKRITDENLHVEQISNYCGTGKMAFAAYAIDGSAKYKSDIYTFDIETGELESISDSEKYRILDIAVVDRNSLCFIGSEGLTCGRNENYDLYGIDLKTRKTTRLTEDFDKSFESGNLISDSLYKDKRNLFLYRDSLYFRVVDRNRTILCKLDPDGEVETVHEREGTIDSFGFLADCLILVGTSARDYHEIIRVEDGVEEKLTSYNEWLSHMNIVEPEYVRFRNEDGVDIEGWVLIPAGGGRQKSCPGILKIHGGPKMAFGNLLSHENQLLVQKGYFVMYCNPRGSDGRGNAFLDIRGKFAEKAYGDLIGFTECVIERYPNLDRDNLGVMGGSYGGYMVNYIIGKTHMFKAAVSERGISNLISACNTTDIGHHYFSDYVGKDRDMWESRDMYIDNSPIFSCDKISTPTLFIHGKDDKRCNYTESLQMYSAMKFWGIETKICIFEGENHSLTVRGKPANRLRRLRELICWFDNHLYGGACNGNFGTAKKIDQL